MRRTYAIEPNYKIDNFYSLIKIIDISDNYLFQKRFITYEEAKNLYNLTIISVVENYIDNIQELGFIFNKEVKNIYNGFCMLINLNNIERFEYFFTESIKCLMYSIYFLLREYKLNESNHPILIDITTDQIILSIEVTPIINKLQDLSQ